MFKTYNRLLDDRHQGAFTPTSVMIYSTRNDEEISMLNWFVRSSKALVQGLLM